MKFIALLKSDVQSAGEMLPYTAYPSFLFHSYPKAKIGQQEQARRELSTAIDLYRAMDMTFWLPQTEAALAQVEGRP